LPWLCRIPGADGYSPTSIALWVFLTDDVGHGTREFWITVALAVTAVYALIVFFLIRGLRSVVAKLR
jgi:hypothetical protein